MNDCRPNSLGIILKSFSYTGEEGTMRIVVLPDADAMFEDLRPMTYIVERVTFYFRESEFELVRGDLQKNGELRDLVLQ